MGLGSGKEGKKEKEQEFVGRANCAICMDTETGSDTAWAVLLSCGHVFHMHCVTSCLRVKPECPTCRAACQPEQAQRVFLSNAVSTETADVPSSSVKAENMGKFRRDSRREPKLECSLYPKISGSAPDTFSPPSSTPADTHSHYATAGASSSATPARAELGTRAGGSTGTESNINVTVSHGRVRRQKHNTGYDNTGYQGYQYATYPPQYHHYNQTYTGNGRYATLVYDPSYPNQPRMVTVHRRDTTAEGLALGAALGTAAALCLCCTIQ